MNKHDQNGSINSLLAPLILITLLFFGAAGFGYWAFMERQDYKLNTDEKVAAAVKLARQDESTKKDKQFAEEEKNPLEIYNGPAEFGSLSIAYPKTWSAYIDDTGRSSADIDGFFYPGVVPSITSKDATFALRIKVINQDYQSAVSQFNKAQQNGLVTVEPYSLPQVPDVVGVIVNGQVTKDKTGTIVVLPLREKSIQVSTEGGEYKRDFVEHVLPNLTFVP
jgi:archaellum component FlaF (FlaF/FlaG flagellin family)